MYNQRGVTHKVHNVLDWAQVMIQGVKLEVGRGPDEVGVEVPWAYAEAARRTATAIFLENMIRKTG